MSDETTPDREEAATRARAEALREFGNRMATPKHPGLDGPTLYEVWLEAHAEADSLTPTPARTIPTTATVRANLAATTAADNEARWNRALKGGA